MAETTAPSVIKVTGIHHISLPCNDLQRAIRFYTEVLGMESVRIIEGETAPHFLGTNLPTGLQWDDSLAEQEHQEYLAAYEQSRPGGPGDHAGAASRGSGRGGAVPAPRRRWSATRCTTTASTTSRSTSRRRT